MGKKVLLIVLSVMLAGSLVACGTAESEQEVVIDVETPKGVVGSGGDMIGQAVMAVKETAKYKGAHLLERKHLVYMTLLDLEEDGYITAIHYDKDLRQFSLRNSSDNIVWYSAD